MGQGLFGYEYDHTGHTRDVNVAYVSGTLASGSGNYGLVVIPATMSGLVALDHPLYVRPAGGTLIRSGKTTIAPFDRIYGATSQACSRIMLTCTSSCQFVKSGANQNYGVQLQANIAYDIPVNNSNAFWISGSNQSQTVYWTVFG